MINFDIDLTKFGIKAKDEVFCIQSEYMADRNFMNIMMSKRYKDKKKIYKCSHCGKDFKAPSDITRHLASHSSEKSYHCEDCDTSFSLKHNLERHIQKLHIQDCKKEGLKFKCEFCGMDYNEKSSLKTHQLKYHMSEGQESQTTRHQCSTCGVSYAYKQSLNEHVQVEHEGKKLICPICGKHFRKKQSLKSHHREHLYGKELSCDLCGNTFRETYQLTRHKKFKCMKQDNKLILKKFECKCVIKSILIRGLWKLILKSSMRERRTILFVTFAAKFSLEEPVFQPTNYCTQVISKFMIATIVLQSSKTSVTL